MSNTASSMPPFTNPFRAGAGHRPPYLAGRKSEQSEFAKLLTQEVITDNLVLTGLRGVGKTVLLEELKPIALSAQWMWVGTDLSETVSVSEATLAQRLITDLAVVTAAIKIGETEAREIGFTGAREIVPVKLGYSVLMSIYESTPGLIIDKLKAFFAAISPIVKKSGKRGIVFAYDEAQTLADHAAKEQYPLSLLLDLFQSVQRQGIPFMLLLVGLPTLFPKLVDARTYAERMFRVMFLKQLTEEESRDAITKPIEAANCPVKFTSAAITATYKHSGGYPYFIQFICREAYDAYSQKSSEGKSPSVPITEIIRKLDTDFFAGRWAKVTDRQQELLYVIAKLDHQDDEFTVQEVSTMSQNILDKPFSRTHVSQMISQLIVAGLIYKDRHGKYLFAVPLMAGFIRRVMGEEQT